MKFLFNDGILIESLVPFAMEQFFLSFRSASGVLCCLGYLGFSPACASKNRARLRRTAHEKTWNFDEKFS